MPARKIPLVWKTQKESEQIYFKYNPASQRLVRYGCDCPPSIVLPKTCQDIVINSTNNTIEIFVNAIGISTTYQVVIPSGFYTYEEVANVLEENIINSTEQYGTASEVVLDPPFYQIKIDGTGYDEDSTAGFQSSTNSILRTIGYTGSTYTSLSNETAVLVVAEEPTASNCP
jgi:hypothetical protein